LGGLVGRGACGDDDSDRRAVFGDDFGHGELPGSVYAGREEMSGKCLLGGVLYIVEKAAWKVANELKWLLGGLGFFETWTARAAISSSDTGLKQTKART
jgi:hypothetical protein